MSGVGGFPGPLYPVILAGGAGRRLWPVSNDTCPKPFVALDDDASLLQATARSLAVLDGTLPPLVVCAEEHRFLAQRHLRDAATPPAAIVTEPTPRGTASAVAAAAFEALTRSAHDGEPLLLVLSVDHRVSDGARFARAVRAGVRAAANGSLVAFGVTPQRPETGYGYLRPEPGATGPGRVVERFVEKPDAATAAALLAGGGWYWNSGLYVFGAARYLQALARHAPRVHEAVLRAHRRATRTNGFVGLAEAPLNRSPSVSVERAVMERTDRAVVVELDAGWSDLGSWPALAHAAQRDAAQNTLRGNIFPEAVRGCFIHAGARPVAALGLHDLVVVDTPQALLVAARAALGDIAALVDRIPRGQTGPCRPRREVERPWGRYETLHEGRGFKVRHLIVDPGQRLSLQSHRHRAEHWVVVRGDARVTQDDETFTLAENDHVFIATGTRHRLANPGCAPLEVMEVQFGPDCNDDDVVRLEDDYGRAGAEHPPR